MFLVATGRALLVGNSYTRHKSHVINVSVFILLSIVSSCVIGLCFIRLYWNVLVVSVYRDGRAHTLTLLF